MINQILQGDTLLLLDKLNPKSINCCVTSPPYYALRNYKLPKTKWPKIDFSILGFQTSVKEQECCLGFEKTPLEFVAHIVLIFRKVKEALRDDGTLWLNFGDSYYGSGQGFGDTKTTNKNHNGSRERTKPQWSSSNLKPKDLIGIPWMVAFALRDDGWYLRQDIIWAKKNCMPESVTDRCTKSHEYIFMLSKSQKYFYDQEAIKEPALYDIDGSGTQARKARQKDNAKSLPTTERAGIRQFKDASKMNGKNSDKQRGHSRRHNGFNDRWDKMTHEEQCTGMRNKRDVWFISPAQFPEAHFATFPEEIPAICIKAGCPVDGLVLDPFMGAGTTALVARKLQRNYIGFELNPDYIKIAEKRIYNELGFFA